jgi:hypothetical protein
MKAIFCIFIKSSKGAMPALVYRGIIERGQNIEGGVDKI